MITGPLFSPLASCRTSPLLFFSPAYFDVWNSSNFHASFLQINKMCQIKSVHVSFFTKQYFAIKWHVAILQCPGFRDATSPTVFHDLPLQPFWSHCWLEPAKLVAVHHSRLDCKTWQFVWVYAYGTKRYFMQPKILACHPLPKFVALRSTPACEKVENSYLVRYCAKKNPTPCTFDDGNNVRKIFILQEPYPPIFVRCLFPSIFSTI